MPAHKQEVNGVMTSGLERSPHTAASLLTQLCILFEAMMLKLNSHGIFKPVPLCYSKEEESCTPAPPCHHGQGLYLGMHAVIYSEAIF